MKTRVSVLVVLLTLATGSSVQAQNEPLPFCEREGVHWGLGPTLLPAPDGKKLSVRGTLDGCVKETVQLAPVAADGLRDGFPGSYVLRFDVDMLWPDSELDVPDANTLRAGAGWSISLSKPPLRAPRDWPIDSLDSWDGGGFNLGFLEFGATVGFESSADWDERHATLGAQARYAINARGLGRLLPSVVAQFELVDPASSKVRDDLGLTGDRHRRWSLRGYWNTNLGFAGDALRRFQLQADAALYRTSGLEQVLTDAGWDSGEYVTVSLSYVNRHKLLGPIALSSIYARYSGGQWPTAPVGGDAFTAGIGIAIGGS